MLRRRRPSTNRPFVLQSRYTKRLTIEGRLDDYSQRSRNVHVLAANINSTESFG